MSKHSQNKPKAPLSPISLEILGYLRRHPRACDSLLGIATWWLPNQRIHTLATQVKNALDDLVALGFVRRTTRPGVEPLYRLNRQPLMRTPSLTVKATNQA